MKAKSGKRPNKVRAGRLSSLLLAPEKTDVLLASRPNCNNCCSKFTPFLFELLGVLGVEEFCRAELRAGLSDRPCKSEEVLSCFSSSRSCESFQVDGLTMSCSVRWSCWTEVSWEVEWTVRSRPRRSELDRPLERGSGEGREKVW